MATNRENRKHVHLQMIQDVVNRLSQNSFLLKGWSVVLVSAILALSASNGGRYAWLALFPAIVFWGLDGYFLWQERLFRELYDEIRKGEEEPDLSMDTSVVKDRAKSYGSALISLTIVVFHLTVVLVIILAWYFQHTWEGVT